MMDSKIGTGADRPPSAVPAETRFTDPVCGMEVDGKGRGYTRTHEGRNYRFCSLGCVEKFEAQPERFLKPHEPRSK
jgi:YHS domain-containing protein